MCIFSLYRSDGCVILTHNRDEDFRRKSSPTLITKKIGEIEATYPLDILGGGTWVLTSKYWTTAILNGATERHARKPPYKHSRGVFPLNLIQYSKVESYIDNLDLQGIEPFTQIILHNNTHEAWCLRWDEKQKSFYKITDSLFVTSSATLYTTAEKEKHAALIKQINTINSDNLADIHEALKWKDKDGFPSVKTTSMVQVYMNSAVKRMRYKRYFQ